jgi:hypothetical protein
MIKDAVTTFHSDFGLRHCFDIRHSCFVIQFNAALDFAPLRSG